MNGCYLLKSEKNGMDISFNTDYYEGHLVLDEINMAAS